MSTAVITVNGTSYRPEPDVRSGVCGLTAGTVAHTNSNQHVSTRLTGHEWFLTFCSQAKIINIVKMLHFVFCVEAKHKISELRLPILRPKDKYNKEGQIGS